MPEKIQFSEKIKKYGPKIRFLIYSTAAGVILKEWNPSIDNYHQLSLLIFGVFHVLGRMADIVSTDLVTRKSEEVEKSLRIKSPIVFETNELLPLRPRLKDMLRPDIIVLELAEAIPLSTLPIYGLARGLKSFHAAYTHARTYKSLVESTRR